MTRVALMAAFTAVAAQTAIPLEPVPFTLQVLAVILTGLLLGPRYGALAMTIYLLVGAIGVPVFAGFRGGLGSLLGDTGGYLLPHPPAAAPAAPAARARAAPPPRAAPRCAGAGPARARAAGGAPGAWPTRGGGARSSWGSCGGAWRWPCSTRSGPRGSW